MPYQLAYASLLDIHYIYDTRLTHYNFHSHSNTYPIPTVRLQKETVHRNILKVHMSIIHEYIYNMSYMYRHIILIDWYLLFVCISSSFAYWGIKLSGTDKSWSFLLQFAYRNWRVGGFVRRTMILWDTISFTKLLVVLSFILGSSMTLTCLASKSLGKYGACFKAITTMRTIFDCIDAFNNFNRYNVLMYLY